MHDRQPNDQLEILGVGLSRTGTLSLKVALEELGYGPCRHSLAPATVGADQPWQLPARGGQIDWRQLLAGYRSSVDWLCARYCDQVLEAFPQAKVILTVRDPIGWYESTKESLYATSAVGGQAQPTPSPAGLFDALGEAVWEELFDGRFPERDHALGVYARHIEGVIERVPSDRLLVFDVGEGWGPLCEFLEVPPPSIPFPHLNDRTAFWIRVSRQSPASGPRPLPARRPVDRVLGPLRAPANRRRGAGRTETMGQLEVAIGGLACIDGSRELSQRQVLELLGLSGDPFAEGVFARCGVRSRRLDLDREMLADSLQGRTERVEGLLLDRACAAIDALGVDLSEVSTLISASLVTLGCPSLAHRLVERLGLDPRTDKYHLTGVGCASAVPLVRLGAQALADQPQRKVLVVAAESMSGLLCRRKPNDPRAKTIGSAIFGDGCAALVLEAANPNPDQDRSSPVRRGPLVIATMVHQIPSSLGAVAMVSDSRDSYLGLARNLPDTVGERLRPLVDSFLARHALTGHMIDHWILHPGGRRIIEQAQAALDLDQEAVATSYEVLGDRGNVGTASIFYVLERTLSRRRPRPGQRGLVVTVGPGVTVGLMLVRF